MTFEYLVVTFNKDAIPQELTKIKKFRMVKAINDHVRVYLEAELPGAMDLTAVGVKTEITITLRKLTQPNAPANGAATTGATQETLIFKGVVVKIELTAANDIFAVKVEGASHTYELDLKLQNRAFQNTALTYQTMIQQVTNGYDVTCWNSADQTEAIGGVFLQYRRTAWQHLIRMASQRRLGLTADCLSAKPAFWFGVPERKQHQLSELQEVEYQITKDVAEFQRATRNQYLTGVVEKDYRRIRIAKLDRIFEIGDQVTFQQQSFYVCQAVSELVGSALRHSYCLVTKAGLQQNLIFNDPIKGVAIEGKAVKVEQDRVKVHLTGLADEPTDPPAATELYSFPYATFYAAGEQTGWYAMPETGDSVQLVFPGNRESDAYVTASLRQAKQGEDIRIGNPALKYFRSKYAKVLLLGEDEIVLIAYGAGYSDDPTQKVLVRLNTRAADAAPAAGIEISSFKNVKLIAGANLVLNSGNKATFTAGTIIDLQCRSSRIILDGAIELQGNPVKLD
jgi:hypothetical protein